MYLFDRLSRQPVKTMMLLVLLVLTALPVRPAQAGSRVLVRPTAISDYLTNPGIGWQHAPGSGTPLLPETVSYPNRAEISWKILNPAEGVYDWTALDTRIAAAVAEGKQISFRVYTMRGESYGGHQVPNWVIANGAKINSSTGDPDYSNCTYQLHWGQFVEQLRQRYDGNPAIAFIDISGYGDFNEWSWVNQTEWDDDWLAAYSAYQNAGYTGTPPDGSDISTTVLDSQARRRLADMYIGGAFTGHKCRTSSGATQTVNYSYTGFQTTQLVMPYAGTRQSTQYVFARRRDVGFRHDCLGQSNSTTDLPAKVGGEIARLWPDAPIVYEFCAYLGSDLFTQANTLLRATHGSIVHDNLEGSRRNATEIENLMRYAGYRYFLREASYPAFIQRGASFTPIMKWQNVGYAPSYPRMGQTFALHFYLTSGETVVQDWSISADLSEWMPADPLPGTPPDNVVSPSLSVPAGLAEGTYTTEVAVIDTRTGLPINLGFAGRNAAGRYPLGTVQVVETLPPATPGITLTPGTGSVAEGGAQDSYMVELDKVPTAPVTLDITTDGQTEVQSGAGSFGTAIQITFTSANWDIPQTVNVRAVDDSVYEGTHSSAINHAVAPGSAPEYAGLTAALNESVSDNEPLPPSPPPLNKPRDGSYTADTTPGFKWKSSSGAVEYGIEVSTDPGFADGTIVFSASGAFTKVTVPEGQALSYDTYYWRARARDSRGNWGSWSAPFTFDLTLHKKPTDGRELDTQYPAFQWVRLTGALGYHLQVDDDPNFGTPEIDRDDLAADTGKFESPTALGYDVYYWRVRYLTGSGWSAWMPVWQVTLVP